MTRTAPRPTRRRLPGRPVLALALALATLLSLGGCGYSIGYQDFGASSRTVTLRVAGNATLRQRFEIPLTRALQEELPIHTNFRLTGPESADHVLAVEIVDVANRSMVGGGFDAARRRIPVREGALEFAVATRLLDAQSGEILIESKVLDRAEYRIAVGETEAGALEEASRDLARKIVLALENPF